MTSLLNAARSRRSDRGSKFADDYNMWQPNATDATTYYALGSYFARRNGGNNQAAPSLDEVSKLRAVKTDLLVRGKMKTDNNEVRQKGFNFHMITLLTLMRFTLAP